MASAPAPAGAGSGGTTGSPRNRMYRDNERMSAIDRARPRHRRALSLSTAALAATLAGCNLVPEDGYDPVPQRELNAIEQPAAPLPPPVVPGIMGGEAEVPVLAAAATPPGVTQAMVEEGAELYGTVCAACHGAGGAGSPAAPALQDEEWLNISGAFDEIVNVIHTGVANPKQFAAAMPPLGGGNFNEQQVRAIAAYVFALSNQQQ